MKRFIMVVLSALSWLFMNEPLMADSALYFTSSPTSWVGQGQTKLFDSPITDFSTTRQVNAVGLVFDNQTDWYYLYLIGPDSTQPTAGFYPNATRWPFNGSGPGLSFFGDGRGDNTLTGYFNILEAKYDTSGNVTSFAVDFMQYDEGVTANWVSGSFRYNSSIPIPEPASALLMIIGAALIRKKYGR